MRPDLNHFAPPPRPPAVGDIAQRLRELPTEAAPPYDFAEFRRRGRERAEPRRRLVAWPHAAAAAGLMAFVGAMAVLGTRGGSGSGEDGRAASSPPTAAVVPDNGGAAKAAGTATGSDGGVVPRAGASVANSSTSALSANDDPADQARAAREWLSRQPSEPALVRAGPRLAVASLEDRIAWFDDALTDQRLQGANPAQLRVLQEERARLVSSLAQVRFAEALVANGS
jgi:hypothetical protein